MRIHTLAQLGYFLLLMALALWLACKYSEELLVKSLGCRDASASGMWAVFLDLDGLTYEELVSKDLHALKHQQKLRKQNLSTPMADSVIEVGVEAPCIAMHSIL